LRLRTLDVNSHDTQFPRHPDESRDLYDVLADSGFRRNDEMILDVLHRQSDALATGFRKNKMTEKLTTYDPAAALVDDTEIAFFIA
jgi:hypothetical protein